MYYGNTVPASWPERASRETYEEYAKRPSWHIEEAAALVAGFVPRHEQYLNFRPLHDRPRQPMPSGRAKTWGQLLEGPVGTSISLYARARHVRDWDFSANDLYVTPSKFLEFCSEVGIRVPRDLHKAVEKSTRRKSSTGDRVLRDVSDPIRVDATAARRRSYSRLEKRKDKKRRRHSVVVRREALYKDQARQISADLRSAAVRVTANQLQELVERCALLDRTVVGRTFQGYLEKWRSAKSGAERSFAIVLNQVLRGEPGCPSEDDRADQKKRMPKKYAELLWPAAGQSAQLRK